jgi:hypothetical protein
MKMLLSVLESSCNLNDCRPILEAPIRVLGFQAHKVPSLFELRFVWVCFGVASHFLRTKFQVLHARSHGSCIRIFLKPLRPLP